MTRQASQELYLIWLLFLPAVKHPKRKNDKEATFSWNCKTIPRQLQPLWMWAGFTATELQAKDKTNWIKIIFLVHKLVFCGDGLKRACYWIYELVGPFNGWLTATLPIEVGDVTIDGAKTAAALQIGFLEIMALWKLLHFTYFGMSKCSIYLNWG